MSYRNKLFEGINKTDIESRIRKLVKRNKENKMNEYDKKELNIHIHVYEKLWPDDFFKVMDFKLEEYS